VSRLFLTQDKENHMTKLEQLAKLLDAVKSGQVSQVDAERILTDSGIAGGQRFTLKVSEKGCVHIRGVRGISSKFGLSLYVEALEDLFAKRPEIEQFVKANAAKLSRKERVS
jgi:hypothetical protein